VCPCTHHGSSPLWWRGSLATPIWFTIVFLSRHEMSLRALVRPAASRARSR
jgi:hypothetical protein